MNISAETVAKYLMLRSLVSPVLACVIHNATRVVLLIFLRVTCLPYVDQSKKQMYREFPVYDDPITIWFY